KQHDMSCPLMANAPLGQNHPATVAVINFAGMTWRMAMTSDFSALSPFSQVSQLACLDWLPGGG
ncbi:MAG: hypothetical protein QOJ73_7574, partial [Streptosporangiaceae bacterium]|nr:hypothetical protein [Streptosporangiaceae bacterium]